MSVERYYIHEGESNFAFYSDFPRDKARMVIDQIMLAAGGDPRSLVRSSETWDPPREILNFPEIPNVSVWSEVGGARWHKLFTVLHVPLRGIVSIKRYWSIEGFDGLNGCWETPEEAIFGKRE